LPLCQCSLKRFLFNKCSRILPVRPICRVVICGGG
jgi:hypothetical protein